MALSRDGSQGMGATTEKALLLLVASLLFPIEND